MDATSSQQKDSLNYPWEVDLSEAPYIAHMGDFTFASEDDYKRFKYMMNKGTFLVSLMEADDSTAGKMMSPPCESIASSFVDHSELSSWGYRAGYTDPTPDYPSHFDDVLPSLEISSTKSDFVKSILLHLSSVEKDGEMYEAQKRVQFTQYMNVKTGFMAATLNLAPVDSKESKAPKLRHWSDVAFLQWQEESRSVQLRLNHKVSLKYVFRSGIINKGTKEVIQIVLKASGQQFCLWPGVTFNMDTWQGKALLGTPNGQGVGFLLAQHKKQLGHKVIEKVTIYRHSAYAAEPSLVFYVKPFVGETPVNKVIESK